MRTRSSVFGLCVVIAGCLSGCSGDDSGGPSEQPSESAMMDAEDSGTMPGPKTAYPGGRWSPPEPTYGSVIETAVEIEMSDGVVLVGDVSYPADPSTGERASGEFPTILTQNPYGGAFGASRGEIFVTHGYIFASIDVRGTSRSGAEHDMFSRREAEDGAALVMWASTLKGSDGRVGLWGCSQLGINQLETATQLGPNSPVKAMIPGCLSGDFYRDTLTDNGIPGPTAKAMANVWADASMGGDMAYYREYWQTRDRVARAAAIDRADIPTLMWVGWREGGSMGALELYTALQNRAAGRPASAPMRPNQEVSGKYQVIVGDWGHGGGLDRGIELQWYDTWIKGIDTGLPKETKTPLHLEERAGSKRWINASTYPLVETYTQFFLAENGTLLRSAPDGDGQDELTWAAPGDPIDSVEYATEPFADGAMLANPMAARLNVTASNSNLQLLIEIFDRAPDGTTARISHGSILGSLRRLDVEKSWMDEHGFPIRPYLALDEDEPLTPGEPTRLDVPLWPSVWSIEPGHSIVVRISTQVDARNCMASIGTPPVGCNLTDPMLETLPGGVYSLHRGGELSSLVNLPLLAYGDLTTAESAISPTGGGELPLPMEW